MGILLHVAVLLLLGGFAVMEPQGAAAWAFWGLAAACTLAGLGLGLADRRKQGELLPLLDALTSNAGGNRAAPGSVLERARLCLEHLRESHCALEQRAAVQAETLHGELASLRAELETAQTEEKRLRDNAARSAAVLNKAHSVCGKLSADVRHLSQLVAEVSQGVEVQRDRLGQTSSAMERVAAAALESSGRVRELSDNSQSSRQNAATGEQEVLGTVSSIETVRNTIVQLKAAMAGLGEKASNIGQVMNVINEVADQTNLLALNAAIEAARAGEAGRGFAVVADAVRKLAEKTMGATREVEEAVLAIQEETRRNVQTVDEAAQLSVDGAERASRAGDFMRGIVRGMEERAQHLEIIARGAAEQSESSAGTNQALEQIRDVAERTAANMETFTAALLSFKSGMEELDVIVNALATGDYEQAASDKFVQWTSKLDLNVPAIDKQHRMLCGYINDLYTAMKNNRTNEELRSIVKKLRDYTASHFSDEEKHFLSTAYPGAREHQAIHKKFVDRLNEFEKNLESGTATVSMDLLTFLKDWLINHIAGTDPTYVPYILHPAGKKE